MGVRLGGPPRAAECHQRLTPLIGGRRDRTADMLWNEISQSALMALMKGVKRFRIAGVTCRFKHCPLYQFKQDSIEKTDNLLFNVVHLGPQPNGIFAHTHLATQLV